MRIGGDGSLHNLHLTQLFEIYDIRTVLDVGARVGDFGTWLRDGGYRGRILSFEPVPSNLEQLLARSADDPNWEVLPYALGATHETQTINVTSYTALSSFRTPTEDMVRDSHGGGRVVDQVAVEVRRLDEVWSQLIDGPGGVYLKLDTQGWDLEVLEGAAGVLPRIVALQTEVSNTAIYVGTPDMLESLRRVRELGYTISGMYPLNSGPALTPIEFDCVAVRA